jgi:hypothetical protein
MEYRQVARVGWGRHCVRMNTFAMHLMLQSISKILVGGKRKGTKRSHETGEGHLAQSLSSLILRRPAHAVWGNGYVGFCGFGPGDLN